MLKREVKRLQNRFKNLADPIGIVALLFLFLLPTLAILNLSPDFKPKDDNVLGVEDGKGVTLVMVGGVHDVIKEEYMNFKNDNQLEYSAKVIKEVAGRYSKPILQISNGNSSEGKLRVTSQTELNSSQKVSVVLDGMEYVLQDADGNISAHTISIPKGSKSDLYLVVTNTNEVLFNNEISLTVVIE